MTSSNVVVASVSSRWECWGLFVAAVESNTIVGLLGRSLDSHCDHGPSLPCSGPPSFLADVAWHHCPEATAASSQCQLTAEEGKRREHVCFRYSDCNEQKITILKSHCRFDKLENKKILIVLNSTLFAHFFFVSYHHIPKSHYCSPVTLYGDTDQGQLWHM